MFEQKYPGKKSSKSFQIHGQASSKNLLRKILPCLVIFEILGIPNTSPKTKGPPLHILVSFYGVIVYLLLLGLIFYDIYLIGSTVTNSFRNGVVLIHILILNGYMAEALIVTIFSFIYAKSNVKLLHRFQYIDELTANYLHIRNNHGILRKKLLARLLFSLTIFFSSSISAFVMISINQPEQMRVIGFLLIPLNIKRFFCIKYMFYIELANFYIETLTKHLQKFGKVRLPDSYFEILFFKLKVAQKIYRELLEISRMINKNFGPPLAVISGMIIVSSVYCGYNFCTSYSHGKVNERIYGEVVFLCYMGILMTN